MEKIDILMATYNGEKYLRGQIDSILSQTYKNFNLIISDDASTDSTQKILKEYEQKDKRKSTVDFDIQEDFSDVDISSLKDSDEYIFYNGKMIKQSVLLRKALEQRGQAVSTDEKED